MHDLSYKIIFQMFVALNEVGGPLKHNVATKIECILIEITI